MDFVNNVVENDVMKSYMNYTVIDGLYTFYPSQKNLNVYGTVHGGLLCTVADNSMCASCYIYLGNSDNIIYTNEIRYKFLTPARVNSPVKFISNVISRIGNLFYTKCIIYQDGKEIGYAYGIFYLRVSKM